MGEAKRRNDQIDGFMDWAFGKGYEGAKGQALVDRWNARHADLFEVTSDQDPRKLMPRMATEYLKSKLDKSWVHE